MKMRDHIKFNIFGKQTMIKRSKHAIEFCVQCSQREQLKRPFQTDEIYLEALSDIQKTKSL